MTPQAEPIKASRLLVDDFAAMVNRYLQDPKKRIMSDTASTNDVVNQIDSVQKSVHALNNKSSSEAIESTLHDVTALHNTCKEWLRLEAFIKRGFRAQYIANYLSQVEAILSYASQHAKLQLPGQAPSQPGTLAGQVPSTLAGQVPRTHASEDAPSWRHHARSCRSCAACSGALPSPRHHAWERRHPWRQLDWERRNLAALFIRRSTRWNNDPSRPAGRSAPRRTEFGRFPKLI